MIDNSSIFLGVTGYWSQIGMANIMTTNKFCGPQTFLAFNLLICKFHMIKRILHRILVNFLEELISHLDIL